MAADKVGALWLLHIFGILTRYLLDYNDIWRITMIFVPGLLTEPEHEITEQEFFCGFVISFSCQKTGNTQTAIYGHLVITHFAVPFEPYSRLSHYFFISLSRPFPDFLLIFSCLFDFEVAFLSFFWIACCFLMAFS